MMTARARKVSGTPVAIGRQGGIVMVMVTIALVALIAMAGLAMDTGDLMLNKARLQNAVDAAALSGAKTLDDTHNITDAEADARSTLSNNVQGAGSEYLGTAMDAGGTVTVQFSNTLIPFVPGSTPEKYVRVRVTGVPLTTFLLQVVGFNDKRVSASAVSGPSAGAATGPGAPPVCNIAPMMVCGDPSNHHPEADPPVMYGYTVGTVEVLKTSSTEQRRLGGGWDRATSSSSTSLPGRAAPSISRRAWRATTTPASHRIQPRASSISRGTARRCRLPGARRPIQYVPGSTESAPGSSSRMSSQRPTPRPISASDHPGPAILAYDDQRYTADLAAQR